ncbi:uncharacterized protein LOC105020612 [Esox lucius]|uniref:uncharacterized protein LOC105020612 n=1 Tax=Esox lucius TaxID=8010 RepID=UPI0014768FF6|nr:uncharacterized protein LOC105020612 [Esox lucius]
MFTLCLVLVLLFKACHPVTFLYARLGDSVTLQCFDPGKGSKILWYKQTAGQKPELISTIFKLADGVTFHNNFKENPRFTVPGGKGTIHLRISNIQPSDSAMYYCGGIDLYSLEFTTGIFLILTGSSKTVIQQPVSDSVHPGDSVTLNCTINTGTCEGEHSVYWFRHDSGESPPGIIHTNGDRSGQCIKSPESGSPTQSCVYNLPKRNLSLSDTGTYYCAVASCGEILFGNGTKLDVGGCKGDPLLLMYCLVTALVLCVILIIVLTSVLYKISRSCGMHPQPSAPADPSHNQDQEVDTLHYAALNVSHKKHKVHRERNVMDRDTVYSGVTFQSMD